MDIHRTLSALFSNQGAVPPSLLGSLGFPFNDGNSLLSGALAAAAAAAVQGKKLDTPLGIVPFDSAGLPGMLTPTKKIKMEEDIMCSSPVSPAPNDHHLGRRRVRYPRKRSGFLVSLPSSSSQIAFSGFVFSISFLRFLWFFFWMCFRIRNKLFF
ncbi:hypothetical protein CAEBREN_20631 [Caenorhabditis brenneri]|uniref:Uncharacterized protein n=1 Tax=Caenorhabditis brenneri TaxID=135651 RepID=G0NCI5_CAEBE|nr:hypothetical protein CAEBREN_20631 [Caenorhabditis brenneri]